MLTLPVYSGCGNTFVLIDLDATALQITGDWARTICDGAVPRIDGVIAYSRYSDSTWRMRIFNSDGSEAEMCGNGLRCLAQHLQSAYPKLSTITVLTLAGSFPVHYLPLGVAVDMGTPKQVEWDIPLAMDGSIITAHHMDTGVPHVVTEVSDLDGLDINTVGRALRMHPHFAPRGANANFYRVIDHRSIAVRTYERGCERETPACGTGATAAALVAAVRHDLRSPIMVHLASGEGLLIRIERQGSHFKQVLMIGTARLLPEPLQLMPPLGQKLLCSSK